MFNDAVNTRNEAATYQRMHIQAAKSLVHTHSNNFITFIRNVLVLFSIVGQISSATDSVEQLLKAERQELASQWAPIVWLHSKEQYYPSSVISFLPQVNPSNNGKTKFVTINQSETEVTLPALPTGWQSWDTHLMASYNKECRRCPLPTYMYGEKPRRHYVPPVYGVIHPCILERNTRSLSSKEHIKFSDSGMKTSMNTSEKHMSLHKTLNSSTEKPSVITNETKIMLERISNSSKGQSPLFDNSLINDTITSNLDSFENETHNQKGLHPPISERELALQIISFSNNTDVRVGLEESSYIERMSSHNEKRELQNTIPETGDQRDARHQNIHNPDSQQFSVTYWMFYPYNQGKGICTTKLFFLGRIMQPRIGGTCYGEEIHMGSHVGDWEHISIQFEGRLPKKLYISSHNFGAFYNYDPKHHVFHYHSQDTREGISLFPEYPKFIRLHENHPVVFAALGSHGLWPTPGTHQYNSIPVLEDNTDQGTPWLTWQNLEIIDLAHLNELSLFQRHWLSYEGRWGNPNYNCHTLLGGFCEINQGPTGIPRKRINFPCQR